MVGEGQIKDIEIPIKNKKEKQTYYGALDDHTKEFIVQEFKSGNTENTIEFLKYLQQQRPGKRLVIFWDGATYHTSQKLPPAEERRYQEYLITINQDLPE